MPRKPDPKKPTPAERALARILFTEKCAMNRRNNQFLSLNADIADKMDAGIKRAVRLARAEERDQCAEACEQNAVEYDLSLDGTEAVDSMVTLSKMACRSCAAAIRAGGKRR